MLWCEIVPYVTPGDHRLIACSRVLIIEARQKIERAKKGRLGESGEGTCSPQSLLFSLARAPLRYHMKQARIPSNAPTLSADQLL